jgi:hypothetical protein
MRSGSLTHSTCTPVQMNSHWHAIMPMSGSGSHAKGLGQLHITHLRYFDSHLML